jgi:Fe-Mn family superoxide dismutase
MKISRRNAIKQAAALGGTFVIANRGVALSPPVPTPVSAGAASGPWKLEPLGYAFDALEPYIDAKTMEIHHSKHHQAYVDRLNKAVAKVPELGSKSLEALVANLAALPEEVRSDIRNHGGGHLNHELFWNTLKVNKGVAPSGPLAAAIDAAFGSFPKFQEVFSDAAMKVFGSGWTFLVVRGGKLTVESLPNQDTPLSTGGTPILGLDVWEHAYYLKYQNRRVEYVKAFQAVINWSAVAEHFAKATKAR